MLFDELRSAQQDFEALYKIIIKHLNQLDVRDRPAVARYIYGLTWGQGILGEAAEQALRYTI